MSLGIAEGERAAREILGRPHGVIDVGAHHVLKPRDVFGPRPFQIADRSAGADELEVGAWRTRLAEQKTPDLDAVTGHVGKDAAPLPLRLPEPRHVRPAMLLGGARQIGTPTDRDGAAPHDVLAALDGAREHLVLQVAVHELRIFSEP